MPDLGNRDMKAIVERYVRNEDDYINPLDCTRNDFITKKFKNYMSDENLTLFWVIHDGIRWFYDAEKGKK